MWLRVEATNILAPGDPPPREEDYYSIGMGFTDVDQAIECVNNHMSHHISPVPVIRFYRSLSRNGGRTYVSDLDLISYRITEHTA